MEELINLLHTGGYSCVIANEGKIRTFTQRGVADLYDLLTRSSGKRSLPILLLIK